MSPVFVAPAVDNQVGRTEERSDDVLAFEFSVIFTLPERWSGLHLYYGF
jgi:hypothetical protein